MLRTPLSGSRARLLRPSCGPIASQWQLNRPRYFADDRRADQTVLPGSQSQATTDIPPMPKPPVAPIEAAVPPPPTTIIQESNIPRVPPTPAQVQSKIPPPPPPAATASTGPVALPPPPPPKRRTGRFRRFLTSLFIISSLGFGGGVYYSLVNDNFHDFFTEYIPFGEDAVAYFEEREFRRRFPTRAIEAKNYPQIRGENKVTVGRSSGVTPSIVQETGTADLGQKGRHTSAIEDNKPAPKVVEQVPSTGATSKEKTAVVEAAKKESDRPATAAAPASSGPVTTLIDHITIPNATEPVVQTAVKLVNDLITAINADPNASKYQTALDSAKGQLHQVVSELGSLKEQIQKEANDKIAGAHTEFDTAAKELVSRLEKEMQSQELHWREEYENEREKLSKSYQTKLATEVDVARKVAEQRVQNALVEQEILLHRKFAEQVSDRVEAERNGRLSKLSELSTSVSELEDLTGQWNSVIDANLATQHLHVALESVRAAVTKYDHPTPFINELAALKEIGNSNEVVNAAIASIPPVAYQRGIPTAAHLIDRFRRVASEVRKASLLPEDAGVASHAASAVLSRLMFSKKGEGLPEGNDVEAVLTRTEVLLEEGDLDAAAREMNGLHGWAGVLSKDWVGECRRVLETRQALDVIATEARLQSLLVD